MATKNIYINNIDVPSAMSVNFYYRLKFSDTFHQIGTEVPVDASGNFSPGIPLTVTKGVYYILRAENTACGYTYDQELYIPDIPCQCAVGYTLSLDSTYCYKLDIKPADYTGGSNPILMCHYNSASQYGVYGTVFYKYGKYAPNGTWVISDPTAIPTILTTALGAGGYNIANFNTVIITAPNVWINSNLTVALDSRLNITGLWDCGSPPGSGQSIGGNLGFSRQINLADSNIYYIGVGADNVGSININGVDVILENPSAAGGANYFNNIGGNFLFRYWHIFPVLLKSGPNLIQLSVNNNPSSIGILGFEIYAATESQLTSCITPVDLEPYIIFTTRDITNGTLSDLGNYNCNAFPGYTLVYDPDNNTYTCQYVFNQPTIGC